MNKFLSVLFFGLLLIVSACDDKDEVYPAVETLEPTLSFASNFVAKGNVIALGSSPVVDFGFVIGTLSNPDIFQSTKIGMGTPAVPGSFEKHISVLFSGQPTLYIRSYLTNEKGTVYGKVKEIIIPLLTATSVSPAKAKAAEQITITGQNFNPVAAENVVTFNDKPATIIAATTTSLTVQVPDGIVNPESISLEVKTGGQQATVAETFKILPTILNFSPKSGTFGTQIILSGKDFSSVASIKIGDKDASVFNVSNNSIAFNVPSSVTTATSKISVIMEEEVIEVPGEFTIIPPTIISVSPLSAVNGTNVTIKGTGFNLFDFNIMHHYNIVKFGTVQAEIYSSGLNQITAIVPVGLSVGTYKISLFTGIHTVIYGPDFTVPSPTITGFSPSSGIAGTYTTINGTNFGETLPAQPFTILYGSTLVEVYSWSDTSITIMIPLGTPAGSSKFTLNIAGQSVASTNSYTVVP
jgi:hypothetical protein